MKQWIILGAIVLLLALFIWSRRSVEPFVTVDLNTALAQRQSLQFEGERRFNSVADIQAPINNVSSADVLSAVQQTVPVPTSHTSSLLTLLGFTSAGGADDGSNKIGTGVEQTGMVQEKINFCESVKDLDCNALKDPKMAECGICLDGGVSSKGKFHRGGMYISSDDQIRANEVSNASGLPAVYAPTVGSCPAANFVTTVKGCDAQMKKLKCLKSPAPLSTNVCGQCYGADPKGYKGLLVVSDSVADKTKPYSAYLNVSHSGGHSFSGAGIVVRDVNGNVLGTTMPSNQALYDPQQIALSLVEGQQLTVTVYGIPQIWGAWFSDVQTGKRAVDMSVGVQNTSPAIAVEIAGDKNAGPVQSAFTQTGPNAINWLNTTVPATVMWYMRRSEAVPPMIMSAWYGTTPPNATTPVGYDVTPLVKEAATTGTQSFTVSNQTFSAMTGAPASGGNPGDPAVGVPKTLWITTDVGGTIIYQEGQTVTGNQLGAAITFNVTVPATLSGPLYADDQLACATGPMVFTEVGAGLMSSHSCVTPTGGFNVTPYCLQTLFTAAGGTQQGTAWPSSQAAATQLAQNNSAGKPDIDATAAYLNNLGSIAQYGVDSNNKPVSFTDQKNAALMMLGQSLLNPCQTPNAATGPQSPECLDYLYRTSGNPAQDGQSVDPTTLPYSYCSTSGSIAPLNPDGSVNQDNVDTANGYGSLASIRNFYQGIYNQTQNSSDFLTQANAMMQCYGTNIQAPPETPSTCPPPNPDEWQCFPPEVLFQPEVFEVSPTPAIPFTQAQAKCQEYGARLATPDEITAAAATGATWTTCGWASDGNTYQVQSGASASCGAPATASVTCMGVKPPEGADPTVQRFSPSNYHQPQAITSYTSAGGFSDTAVPAIRSLLGNQQCASQDGQNCYTFPSAAACNAWTQNQSSLSLQPIGLNPSVVGSPAGTGWGNGRLVRASDTGAIYFNPNGTNKVYWVPECIPCNDGYSVCDPSKIAENIPSSQFWQKYVQGPAFVCGMQGVVDQFFRQKI